MFRIPSCDSYSVMYEIFVQGVLPDGTLIAVKQLSSKSRQGNREFLNEIGMISCLQHPNLVKLYGCCIEGDQLLVVYEYMENNSLAHVLFGIFFLIFHENTDWCIIVLHYLLNDSSWIVLQIRRRASLS